MDYILLFMLSGYFALVLALVIGIIAIEWILFERAGEPGWKVLIPFYDSFIRHKIAFGEESKWYWFLILIPGYGIYMRSLAVTDTAREWLSYPCSSLQFCPSLWFFKRLNTKAL